MDNKMKVCPYPLTKVSKEPDLLSMKVLKRKFKPKKREFIGWGSRTLVEFLASIGKDTSKPVSQYEVNDIIKVYINENKLIDAKRKKKVLCDAMLQSVFGRKSVNQNRIYDLLESHFAENQEESEDDDLSYDSGENEDGISKSCTRQGRKSSDCRTHKKAKILEAPPRSCFASVTTNNIKLVYLKRSVVEDLLMNPETFDEKVMGSFVRVKSDPNDYFQRNSHQLVQVTGIKKASGTMVTLQISNLKKDVHIYMLSDDDFSEEECEDLGRRVKDGLLKRPTIVELEQKARSLHENIMKHWIERELTLLQNLIDRANEKGWRREYPFLIDFLYVLHGLVRLYVAQVLQTPSEQLRLLREIPEATADEIELEITSLELSTDENLGNYNSSRSIPTRNSETLDDLAGSGTSFNLNVRGTDVAGIEQTINVNAASEVTLDLAGKEDWNGDAADEKAAEAEADGIGSAFAVSGCDGVNKTSSLLPDIIILEDEDDEGPDDAIESRLPNNPESDIWHYVDPFGDTQGPFSMSSLKIWYKNNYFHPDFKVWKTGQTQEAGILLTDVLCQVFPN